ncbi:MAG: transglutaminase domain-containing protein [Opitutaceae bacterium]
MISTSLQRFIPPCPRRAGLWGAFLLAATCAAAPTASVSAGPAGLNSRSGLTPVKNIIELRNDRAGDQYFSVFVRADPVLPQKQYRQDAPQSDGWKGTTVSRGTAILPENILWPIEVEYEKPDGVSAGGKHPYIELDAVPASDAYIKYVACDKFTPGAQVSQAFKDHQKDWDFMVAKLKEILSAAGLAEKSSIRDKVMAIAKFCLQTRKEKKNYSRYTHPVDFCLRGAYCVGAANALVAFCSLLEVPARTIGYGAHTCAEAWFDGKWHWVENWAAIVAQTKEPGPVYSVSFLEMLNDPEAFMSTDEFRNKFCEFNCVDDDSRSGYTAYSPEAYTNWIFPTTPAGYPKQNMPLAQAGLGSLAEISALYPGMKRIRYKCDREIRVWLTPFRLPARRAPDVHIIDQDHGVRQEFHLSSLKNVKVVKACLLISNKAANGKITVWNNMPKDGGDWYYRINGHKVYVRDLGGWNVNNNYHGTGRAGFELTLKPEWLRTSRTDQL